MLLSNIKIYDDIPNNMVLEIACKKNKIDISKVKCWKIIKKSIDARDKTNVHYNYSISINEKEESKLNELIVEGKKNLTLRPVIVGAGPAGLFATYVLALNGYNPILLEQGASIDERVKDVEEFINNRKLNPLSNVQFGEGGAGTFSDGKLTTNVNSAYNKCVLETFVKFGAPEEIMYLSKPHIGTDILREVIKNIRNELIRLGTDVRFNTKVVDFEINNNKITGVILQDGSKIKTNDVVLAIGHSARSTFERLYQLEIKMEPKPFSVGARIEHSQDFINKAQYGEVTKLKLPPAEYKLVYHDEKTNRTCYTFCMCPGGEVIASSSSEGTIVTNGMSNHKRDGKNANSAILVNVNPEDYMIGNNPLSGLEFQKKIEEKAFMLGGSDYSAPAQQVSDYLRMESEEATIMPTYLPGTKKCDLHELFPGFVNDTMEQGLIYFNNKIKGFINNAMLTGPETRSSSPVRIIRDEKMSSNIMGLYPCGEGAGYAGGIMTASIDGIRVAKAIIEL
jgi:uncharacterized FAD-dependent dehydrogenase